MAPEPRPLGEIQGLLLDVGGVLHQGDAAIEGSAAAIARLRERKIPFRLLTNTTRTTRASLAGKLKGFGFDVDETEIVTPASAAGAILNRDGAHPHLFVHPDLLPDCPAEAETPDAVLMGDAGEHFTFENMNRAGRRRADSYDRAAGPAGIHQPMDCKVYFPGRLHPGAERDGRRGGVQRAADDRHRGAQAAVCADAPGMAETLHGEARDGGADL